MKAKDDPSAFEGAVIDIETVVVEGGGGGGGGVGGVDEDPPQAASTIEDANAKAQRAMWPEPFILIGSIILSGYSNATKPKSSGRHSSIIDIALLAIRTD